MTKFQDREAHRKTLVVGSMTGYGPASGGRRGRPKADRETKIRISLSVLPGLYEDIQKIAHVQRRSVSDLIGSLLVHYREQHWADLAEYHSLQEREAGSEQP